MARAVGKKSSLRSASSPASSCSKLRNQRVDEFRMSSHDYKSAQRPSPDDLLVAIADYTKNYEVDSAQAYETARYCLMDTLACGFQALKYPGLHAVVRPRGARAPRCRAARACPARATSSIRSWARSASAPWCAGSTSTTPGSPRSGATLPTISAPSSRCPTICRAARSCWAKSRMTVRDVLTAMIKAHEIQGVLALENSFNRVGLDHVLLVRVASTAVATAMLGGSLEQIVNALSNAWIDGGALAHLPPCAEHGLAQELGRRGRDQPRRAPRVVRAQERDGISLGAVREDLGIPGRAVQGQAAHAGAAARQLRHGERAVQDQLPRGVPRADRGGVRDGAAPEGEGPARARSSAS